MPPFVKKPGGWLNGRENGADARWNAAAVDDLEDRIETAVGSGVGSGGGPTIVNAGSVTTNQTLVMTTYQDVLWVVTVAANNLKFEISGWSTGKSVTLIIKQDAAGNRAVAQLPTAKWEGGSIPTGSLSANAIDIRAFFRGLTETYGFESGTGMA